jgi:hypothetical protein
MCAPMALAAGSFIIGAAQGVMGYMQQSAQAQAQNQMYKQNQQNAARATADAMRGTSMRQAQEQEAAAAQTFETNLQARSARATARVAAGEGGVFGNSVDSLLRDFFMREDRAVGNIERNTEMTVAQLQQEKVGQGWQYVDRVNSMQKAAPPSFADAAIRIAGAGLGAAGQYYNYTNPRYGYGAT